MLRCGLRLARKGGSSVAFSDSAYSSTLKTHNAQDKSKDSEFLHPLGDTDNYEEKQLEKLVFGGENELIEDLCSIPSKPIKKKKLKRKRQHSEGTGNDDDDESYANDDDIQDSENAIEIPRKPAWKDEDDDKILISHKADKEKKQRESYLKSVNTSYADQLKTKFLKVTGAAKWADLNHPAASLSGDEDDDDLLRRSGNFLGKADSLPGKIIQIARCRDLNSEARTPTVLKCVEFHTGAQVAAVAGFAGTLTIFEVNGQGNPKLQSVHFDQFPIHTAHFTVDGTEIIVGSKEHGHFFYYDMMAGKVVKVPWEKGTEQMNFQTFYMSPDGKLMAVQGRYGNIHILTAKTKELIASLKMNGSVYAIAFNKDGTRMFSHGDSSEVYIWDMNSRQCIHKFQDEGCISGSSLAVSPNEQYLASGSGSGIVNIYDVSTLMSSRSPKPLKAIMNLTTEVTSLKFNHASEVLAMSSFLKPNALKFVHFPSITTYSNFPRSRYHMHHVHCVDFSPNSGYISSGNDKGVAQLFRLKYYSNY